MKKLPLLVGVFSLVFSIACGSSHNGGGGTGTGNFSNASLSGQYVYQINGIDLGNSSAAYREAGVFAADGNGNITSGEDDFSEGTSVSGPTSLTGSYAISNDGTGTMVLNFSGGSLNLGITLASTSQVYLIETDSFANGAGVAEQQNTSTLSTIPAGTFAFQMHTLSGVQGSGSLAGAITATGGVISGSDDVLRGGVFDNNTGVALTLNGLFNTPDSSGRGTGSITDSANVTTDFAYYIIDANNLRLFCIDPGILGLGRAEVQTGAPFSLTSLSGGYAFGSSGDDNSFLGGVKTVGSLVAGGDGTVSGGAYDSVQDGNPVANVSFTGSYTMDGAGRAVMTLSPGVNSTTQQILWMVNPQRAFLLSNDTTKVEDGAMDLQQASSFSTSSLNGQQAFVMHGFDLTPQFVDRVGWIQWDGAGSLNWSELVNDSGVAQTSGLLSGSYSVSGNGRVAATVNGLSLSSNDIVVYLVSGSHGYMLENDAGVEINGVTTQQP